jgi:hypothetical protein
MATNLFRRFIMMCKVDSTHKDWKLLYLAAIGEKDKTVLAKRISDAQHAIFLREREFSMQVSRLKGRKLSRTHFMHRPP